MARIATQMAKSTLRREPAATPRCVIWARGGFSYSLLSGSTTSTTKQAHNPEVDT
jgi:hypothetical protein